MSNFNYYLKSNEFRHYRNLYLNTPHEEILDDDTNFYTFIEDWFAEVHQAAFKRVLATCNKYASISREEIKQLWIEFETEYVNKTHPERAFLGIENDIRLNMNTKITESYLIKNEIEITEKKEEPKVELVLEPGVELKIETETKSEVESEELYTDEDLQHDLENELRYRVRQYFKEIIIEALEEYNRPKVEIRKRVV